MLTRQALQLAWRSSHPMLRVVKVPALLFIAAGLGWLSTPAATTVSQAHCIAIRVFQGARVGWVISHNPWHPLPGATSAGSIGVALATMKHAIHGGPNGTVSGLSGAFGRR